ncbi:putative nuclease HARBI1 isoform X2 [Solenopsis invicta]|uniref:putative nuclease HARBI1 isoform X2 n=2 Tax=Solenopsis invicta TaxID=13686 RepID=UPI00193DC4A7|nr:putative nuclease HARBI1 isoform X2 [Solenopsis invicta]
MVLNLGTENFPRLIGLTIAVSNVIRLRTKVWRRTRRMDIFLLWNVLFNNEENDENVWDGEIARLRVEHHFRIPNFFENIYFIIDFKSHFRVERNTFKHLIQTFGFNLLENDDSPKLAPAKQLAIALWIFGNQEVYRSVADRFGVSKDTIWRCVFNVAYTLEQRIQNYIKWPEVHELLNTQQQFAAISDFPGVVGVIDGCHIPISAPTEYPNSYINRKEFYSILLQGICDHKMKFIDVFTGICGSVHDARVWRLSDIKNLIDHDRERYFPQRSHLLADSAYPLSYNMLTPYRDNGHLNAIQHNYNTKLSKTRVIIERTFGILKERFRKLKYVYMYNTDMISLDILACCILHNICIDNEDEPFDNVEVENVNNNYAIMPADDKRDIIAELLF